MKSLIAAVMVGITGTAAWAQTDGLKLGGDIRLRHEAQVREGDSPRQLQRLNFKLAGQTQVNPWASAHFRLGSGGGRTSLNQTLGQNDNAFRNYEIRIDRAYFDLQPLGSVNLYGGRTPNTMRSPIFSDLVWDHDVNFDGVMATYHRESIGFFMHSGLNWVSTDVILGTFQATLTRELGALQATVIGGYYLYGETSGQLGALDGGGTDFKGNTSDAGFFASDFGVLDLGAEFGTLVAGRPLTLGGHFIRNVRADSLNQGYLAGIRYGGVKSRGDWLVLYDYRMLQADSTIGSFIDSDSFLGAGTDSRGHRVRGSYALHEKVIAGAAILIGETGISGVSSTRNRAYLDLTVRF